MIRTEYVCDRCKAVVKQTDQLWEVGIGIECLPRRMAYMTIDPKKSVQWCRPCMEKMNLLGGYCAPENQDPPQSPPTIEDLIREIVAQAIQENR